ncbi:hypothetical protein J3R82DRAFT_5329 [Butyriboletus roseoflavus]|nr:hypothetical protein J3R82DRAFT_5329 [Butyriboletus roseoflavus]
MSEGSWTDDILLKLLNIVVYFTFLGSNIYTIAAPHDIYYSGKETYFTPAPWTFLIWTLIHLLLLGTIVYQFTAAGKKVVIDGSLMALCLARCPKCNLRQPLGDAPLRRGLYLRALRQQHCNVANPLANSGQHIYYIVKKHHAPLNTGDEIFVHLPFSLWHGWTTVLVVLTAFEAFGVNAVSETAGVWTKVFVFLALFFLEGTAAAYAFTSVEGDLPASIAIMWSLFGVFAEQKDPFVHWSSLAFAVLSAFCVVKGIWGMYRRFTTTVVLIEDEERGPLLGGR